MTHATRPAPRRAAVSAAAMGAILLAGCSSGHIGESWQCPLAEGGSCDSVAAADPAVPDPKAAGTAVLAEPLWRVRAAEPGPPATLPCAAECGGFDPFAWLARLFQADPGSGARPPGSEAGAGSRDAGAEASDGDTSRLPAAPDAAGDLPAEPGPPRAEAAREDPAAGDLRTGEVVARIWIAPFVDGNGVYREASYVRVVLEPAGWRIP